MTSLLSIYTILILTITWSKSL